MAHELFVGRSARFAGEAGAEFDDVQVGAVLDGHVFVALHEPPELALAALERHALRRHAEVPLLEVVRAHAERLQRVLVFALLEAVCVRRAGAHRSHALRAPPLVEQRVANWRDQAVRMVNVGALLTPKQPLLVVHTAAYEAGLHFLLTHLEDIYIYKYS